MVRLLLMSAASLLVTVPVYPEDVAAPPVARFDGKVIPLKEALQKRGADPDDGTTGIALVQADGTLYTLVQDEVSRLLFLDKQLQGRDVRLTARLLPGTRVLKVVKVQTLKAGKLFDVDYWCEKCQLAATEPGQCLCCGGDTVLRERPAK